MKVVLSRKGFDNQYGGQPSPILPDGTLLSLPIPAKGENIKFSDIKFNDKTYLEIIKELKHNPKIKDKFTCHLDPDIRKESLIRKSDWKPLFGQTGSSQGHLSKQGITKGDLFLFFGSFRQTEVQEGKLNYVKQAPEVHLIYGYLQVGEIYTNNSFPKHVKYHPHANGNFLSLSNNTIYEATEALSFLKDKKGANCLTYHEDLVLSKQGMSKSKWHLPDIFKNTEISYHSKNSFKEDYFQSAAKGQEFVISEGDIILDWVKDIILKGSDK